ncbi:hypothetical protein [Flavicella sp.]|uniref:hypothetical protein n=1 Tax=Flavicella sp. TaxID=2957742 RepID=UPI0026237066|nr:hypothetical protein [Flavicella sp.]MDG1803985.1 hypothetical protein [Flavicella sp.]MDG2281392.1 hypothetical protein [Flavicella sp.]
MSKFKSLGVKSNGVLLFRKESKQHGLEEFSAVSADQLLMTRGGQGKSLPAGKEGIQPAGVGGTGVGPGFQPGSGLVQGAYNLMGSITTVTSNAYSSVTEMVASAWSSAWDNAETTYTIIDAASSVSAPPGPGAFMLNTTRADGGTFKQINDSTKVGSSGKHYPTR